MRNRRWITREEIAEIHEQRARMEMNRTGYPTAKAGLMLLNARTIRQIDKLDNPLGQRT
jgi:hypothetical protein